MMKSVMDVWDDYSLFSSDNFFTSEY